MGNSERSFLEEKVLVHRSCSPRLDLFGRQTFGRFHRTISFITQQEHSNLRFKLFTISSLFVPLLRQAMLLFVLVLLSLTISEGIRIEQTNLMVFLLASRTRCRYRSGTTDESLCSCCKFDSRTSPAKSEKVHFLRGILRSNSEILVQVSEGMPPLCKKYCYFSR